MTESRAQKGRVLMLSAPGVDRQLYVSSLDGAGFRTAVVESTPAAAEWLSALTPDVIVMDLLPDPDQAWAFIDSSTTFSRDVPVVIFTSLIRPDGGNRRKARSLGCAAFVAKPCSLRQLVDVVSRVHDGERGLEVLVYSD